MNKRWLVLLAPLGMAMGGVAGAAAPVTEPAAPAPMGEVPPPEETALARTQFDAALTANGIDPATARLVACTSEYSTAPLDPTQQKISSVCYGVVGEVSTDPNGPQPILYVADTVHNADGSVFTFFLKYPGPEMLGDPMPGEPTAPITFPPAGAAVTPTTAAPTTAAGPEAVSCVMNGSTGGGWPASFVEAPVTRGSYEGPSGQGYAFHYGGPDSELEITISPDGATFFGAAGNVGTAVIDGGTYDFAADGSGATVVDSRAESPGVPAVSIDVVIMCS
jgi:hypothetical protein